MRAPLLVTALLCVQIGAWSIPFFSSAKSGEPYLHPLSPVENDPTQARAKRQAYQVYVGDDVSVTVDKSGNAETGNWGQWSVDVQCSRTCGGGVQIEKRQCSGDCTGPSTRYVSCNTDACAEETQDFRAEQCSKFDDEPLNGNYYKWLPYKGKNKCELLCKPDNGNFYYKWADKVVDGTKCDAKSNDICVDGVCLPLGCDGKLGSSKKADKCGVCDGDGSSCTTLEGIFDERNLSPGYHDIIKLPVGATNIKVEEMRDTSNNLALKNDSDHFFLNGNSMLSVEKDVEAAGTIFEYDDAKKEKLFAKGPLTEEIVVSLLFRAGNKGSGVKYEFSVPLEEAPYIYKGGDWSACSVTCGKGVMTRDPYCADAKSQARVDDSLCDENNATKPDSEKECKTVDCAAEWYEGDWEECSSTCGNTGEQYRVVYCHQIFADGKRMTVDDGNCTADRPPVRQSCNRFNCPEWQAGPWSACSEKCGDAFQYRSVTCRSEKEGEEGKLLPADSCSSDENLETQRTCNLGPCEGLTFFTSEWKLCEKCNDTEETREVTCKDTTGRAYPLEKCLSDNSTEIPIDTRTCATAQPCIYEWTTSAWSKCSTECGHGHKTRKVFCAIHQLGDLQVVDEFQCQGDKPEGRENCTNEEKCTGTWYSGPWTQCTEECGGGSQTRMSVCLNYDKKPVPEWCDEAEMPTEEQNCNEDPCPTCFDSDFGCCPDNTTFALGDFNEGCSNCSTSEFGCCADNYTMATGAGGQGCSEYVEIENLEASGEEPATEEPTTCTVTSENGEEAQVECQVPLNITALEEDILGNDTLAENGTIHCSKTEFKCCPDWYTPAEGPANEGCPEFVLGACNETEHGCCPDEVTLSRGPNYEGCGEPSCAASLYGCCKDRKTIAFGPHYQGCERSSFPCELSPFGCCPDGETAALGANGTGCGENCLTTKFGCCPDGKTVSRGHNNEGCGCQYAQFGCCPDGKSVARGAGFYGCPDTCAQSQFGCCPDGKTSARGANKEGCPCQYTRYGCCPDGETTALGPRMEGCDDCRYAKYACCPDGETKALGPNYQGCPSTTPLPYIRDGTVAPAMIQACNLPEDKGSVCGGGYKLSWFYDSTEGRCSQFWFGGCDGNANRFNTKEMCEEVCVEPPAKGRCYLPKNEGPLRCDQPVARYYYDHNTRQCAAFWWRGCLGNANNFESWEECSTFCRDIGPIEQATTPAPQVQEPEPTIGVVAVQPEPAQPQPAAAQQQPQQTPQQPQQQQQQQQQQRPAPVSMEEVCRSTQDAGPCSDHSDNWFFDVFTGTCQKFVYGGCGGNLNRFRTQEDCISRCGFLIGRGAQPAQPHQQQQAASQQPGAPQQQPQAAPGPVHPAHAQPIIVPSGGHEDPRKDPAHAEHEDWKEEQEWAHKEQVDERRNPAHADHEKFLEERKQRHEERHRKILERRRQNRPTRPAAATQPAATQPAAVAPEPATPAPAMDPRSHPEHPDHAVHLAERHHQEELRRRQNQQTSGKSREVCSLPVDIGRCNGTFRSWYFEVASGQCEQFTYTGCGGNANRFHSKDKCEALCTRRATAQHDAPVGPGAPVAPARADGPPGSNSVCDETKETGPCTNFQTKWFYNKADGTCNRFHYGGCEGTGNRFDSELACKAACSNHQDACMLPKVQGPCSGKHKNYFYNSATKKCEEFVYGGCLGNTNRFATSEECEARCQNPSSPVRLSDAPDTPAALSSHHALLLQPPSIDTLVMQPEKCSLPYDTGICKAAIPKFYYDIEVNRCMEFFYGGCGGNPNRFDSLVDCEAECAPVMHQALTMHDKNDLDGDTLSNEEPDVSEDVMEGVEVHVDGADRDTEHQLQHLEHDTRSMNIAAAPGVSEVANVVASSPVPELCLLPEQRGSCHGNELRYRYDSDTGVCSSFMYSGCDANANHFESEEACERACGRYRASPVCSQPFSIGHCDLAVSKWYFDTVSNDCALMMWSGCGGNGNRFSSKEECLSLCRVEHATSLQKGGDICELDRDSGPCKDAVTQWYWDKQDSECRQFTFGGCRGNGNRFDDRASCEKRCGPKMQSLTMVDAQVTCRLPFEKGPCTSSDPKWYFDHNAGSCKQFTYGGCMGNTNRFDSETECLAACSLVSLPIVQEVQYKTSTHAEGPFKTGSEISLNCHNEGQQPIVWFKDGDLLKFDHRIQVSSDLASVTMTNVSATDSGEYLCAVGPDAILSDKAVVKVNELVRQETICFDKGPSNTCALTVRLHLCDRHRYFSHCCGSCIAAGYKMLD